jgi:hypothetical protein
MWSTFTGLSANRAVIWSGAYVVQKVTGKVFKENSSRWNDAGGSYGMGLTTGWLAVDGIGGFQRVYRLQIRGDYKSQHKLAVKVGYDYADSYESSVVLNPDEMLSISRYGDSSPYGNETVFGGINSAYRFEVGMKRQKCEAIRFSLAELPDAQGGQDALNISDIVLLVGVKGSLSRLATAQTSGAKT